MIEKYRGIKPTVYNTEKIPYLIELMKNREVSFNEVGVILEMTEKARKNSLSRVISTISAHYPIYDVGNCSYRILTREVLDEWEKEHATSLKQLLDEYSEA